jgi:hypothetical protein
MVAAASRPGFDRICIFGLSLHFRGAAIPSYTGSKFGGEDGIRTRRDRGDLGITRRLAAGLKCASLLDLPWLFRCFCKDPGSDLARPGFTRAGFPTFPGELAELAQLPQNGAGGEDRTPDLRFTKALLFR